MGPLHDLMVTYCQLDPVEQTSAKVESNDLRFKIDLMIKARNMYIFKYRRWKVSMIDVFNTLLLANSMGR